VGESDEFPDNYDFVDSRLLFLFLVRHETYSVEPPWSIWMCCHRHKNDGSRIILYDSNNRAQFRLERITKENKIKVGALRKINKLF